MSFKHRLLVSMVPLAATLLLRLLGMTLRIRTVGDSSLLPNREKQGEAVIYVPWHSRLLLGVYMYRGLGINAMSSQSRDGEILARSIEWMGFSATRGSSSRGAVGAMKTLAALLEEGTDIIITPDGPKGPAMKAKMGAIHLAKLSGAKIVSCNWSCSRFKELKSWDRLRIPMPFSKCVMRFSEPVSVPSDCTKEEMQQKLEELQASMDRMVETEREDLE
ncbi:MAG: lysophospholipid acyltransferase family protein [Planctomycetota bacterium]|nr:lysophospholipid acyltransferase family protein [Planctomycetota bacterium]MDA1139209.1 lysophospholipid acyltransferase family protein [Planctomycetota bacterium]